MVKTCAFLVSKGECRFHRCRGRPRASPQKGNIVLTNKTKEQMKKFLLSSTRRKAAGLFAYFDIFNVKQSYLKFLLFSLFVMVGLQASAYNAFVDGIYYNLNNADKTAAVTYNKYRDGSNYSGSIAIPEYIYYNNVKYVVDAIDDYAFYGCDGLTSITIPSSIKIIAYQAFYSCTGLTAVHISDIAAWCRMSISVTISNPLYYAKHLFLNGEEVTDLVIPESVTNIRSEAFVNCRDLRTVTITSSVTSIGSSAFKGCQALTKVTIHNGVSNIGSEAFKNCDSLSHVTIPSSVTSIGSEAFRGCNSLKKVIVQDMASWCAIQFYGYEANPLYYAKHLYSDEYTEVNNIVIPYGATKIGAYAFYDFYGLTSVTIPNSVTTIESRAFYGCSGLTSVNIPSSITLIGRSAFFCCNSLKKVIVPDIVSWCSLKFDYDSDNPLYYAKHFYSNEETEIKDLVIPNSVTSIQQNAFTGCSGFNSITIPKSVTSIGTSAFFGCSGLATLTIPNSIIKIGNYAFSGCSGLETISVEVGNPVYDSRDNCNAIIETASNTLLFGCKNTTIPNSVANISKSAFGGCSGLNSITIPNSITKIEDYSFQGCSSLSDITIPNSVTSIGIYAFENCSGLTSINIPSSVTNIGRNAFYGCTALNAVRIPDLKAWCELFFESNEANPLYYAHHLFLQENEIKDLEIPDSTTTINSFSFAGCNGLTAVTIPKTVGTIGNCAFNECI